MDFADLVVDTLRAVERETLSVPMTFDDRTLDGFDLMLVLATPPLLASFVDCEAERLAVLERDRTVEGLADV